MKERRRRLGVGAQATLIIGVPAALLAFAGPPRIPDFAGYNLTSTYLPPDQVIVAIALVFWIIWACAVLAAGIYLLGIVAHPPRPKSAGMTHRTRAAGDRQIEGTLPFKRRSGGARVAPSGFLLPTREFVPANARSDLGSTRRELRSNSIVGDDVVVASEPLISQMQRRNSQGDSSIEQPNPVMVQTPSVTTQVGECGDQARVDNCTDEPAPVENPFPLPPASPSAMAADASRDDNRMHPDASAPATLRTPVPETAPRLNLLGAYSIQRGRRILHKGWLSKAKEMLAYLAAYPDGASKDSLIELLWPESELSKSDAKFRRTKSRIRAQVRSTSDRGEYVVKVGESFRLDPDGWWVDAWEFERLVFDARTAPAEQQSQLLAAATELYRGEFAGDCYYSWAEPVRERFRRMYVRACGRLGELLCGQNRHDEALSVLDRAIEILPANEDLHRQAMTIESSIGREADALARFGRLTEALHTQIAVEPSSATTELARQIEATVKVPALSGVRSPGSEAPLVSRGDASMTPRPC